MICVTIIDFVIPAEIIDYYNLLKILPSIQEKMPRNK